MKEEEAIHIAEDLVGTNYRTEAADAAVVLLNVVRDLRRRDGIILVRCESCREKIMEGGVRKIGCDHCKTTHEAHFPSCCDKNEKAYDELHEQIKDKDECIRSLRQDLELERNLVSNLRPMEDRALKAEAELGWRIGTDK